MKMYRKNLASGKRRQKQIMKEKEQKKVDDKV